jgi:RNA polymerase sigma factor (sigma-70 family)
LPSPIETAGVEAIAGVPDPLQPWLARAAAGDERAVAHLLDAVAPVTLGLVRAIVGRRALDVEDVAQEALLAIADAINRFRGESSFVQYARRIAVRTAVTARRRLPRESGDELDEQLPSDALADDERLTQERCLAALRSLLDELPQGQAESLAMRVVLGCSLDEVAAATEVPVNTVRSRIRLAKKHIRDRITRDPRLAALFEVALEEPG